MLQQCSLDSQKRASIENTTLSLFENQTEITDRIERMDIEIQGLGEKVLEIIPSLWMAKMDKNIKTDEENETNGLDFYNESVKMETDGDEDTVSDNGEHVIQWHSTPRGKSSRKSNLTDQSIII